MTSWKSERGPDLPLLGSDSSLLSMTSSVMSQIPEASDHTCLHVKLFITKRKHKHVPPLSYFSFFLPFFLTRSLQIDESRSGLDFDRNYCLLSWRPQSVFKHAFLWPTASEEVIWGQRSSGKDAGGCWEACLGIFPISTAHDCTRVRTHTHTHTHNNAQMITGNQHIYSFPVKESNPAPSSWLVLY